MSLTRNRRQRAPSASYRPESADATFRPGNRSTATLQGAVPVVVKRARRAFGVPAEQNGTSGLFKPSAASGIPSYKKTEQWFWLAVASAFDGRLLVKPTGEQIDQGPLPMTHYRTQDGQLGTCSIDYFEANATPYYPRGRY